MRRKGRILADKPGYGNPGNAVLREVVHVVAKTLEIDSKVLCTKWRRRERYHPLQLLFHFRRIDHLGLLPAIRLDLLRPAPQSSVMTAPPEL